MVSESSSYRYSILQLFGVFEFQGQVCSTWSGSGGIGREEGMPGRGGNCEGPKNVGILMCLGTREGGDTGGCCMCSRYYSWRSR